MRSASKTRKTSLLGLCKQILHHVSNSVSNKSSKALTISKSLKKEVVAIVAKLEMAKSRELASYRRRMGRLTTGIGKMTKSMALDSMLLAMVMFIQVISLMISRMDTVRKSFQFLETSTKDCGKMEKP